MMTAVTWRHAVLGAIIGASAVGVASLDPIAQDPAYHAFADQRPWLGIPNAADVISNLPFLVVGLLGLQACRRLPPDPVRCAWTALFAGVTAVSAGSAYYHWQPTDATLVWDRLPMTVGFMGLWVALLAEHVEARLARLLTPAIALGALTVLYWHVVGDLRPYAWVQLVPLLTVPVVMWLYPGRHTHRWLLAVALAAYLAAKVAEIYDVEVFELAGGWTSGHTLKHLAAAAGCWALVVMLRRRRDLAAAPAR
jgi:hypothetical protein